MNSRSSGLAGKLFIAFLAIVSITSWSSALFQASSMDSFVEEPASPYPYRLTHRRTYPKKVVWQTRAATPEGTLQSVSQVLGANTLPENFDLTQEEAIYLTKPGVVNILNVLIGKLSVPDFDVDVRTLKITPRPDLPHHDIDIDSVVMGSGFVVNPDGYIITNAHVAAKTSAYDQMRADVEKRFQDLYQTALDQMSDEEYKKYEADFITLYGESTPQNDAVLKEIFYDEVDKYLKENLTDKIKQNLVIVDKSTSGNTLETDMELMEVYATGLPATIIDFDEDYIKSHKDIALIKISEKNLPVLSLGNTVGLASGQRAISLGFPSNARISQGDVFEVTFTEGVISAIKNHEGQKIIQLDNKISPGSSGGPLIDSKGHVVGIITFETGPKISGDNFGFALPVELASEILQKNGIQNDLGTYRPNLLLGLASGKNSTCKQALEYYNTAGSSNDHFPVKQELQKPISDCESLIASNQSKDSYFDTFRIFYLEHLTNAIIFTLLVLILLGFGIYSLIKFLRQHRSHALVPSAMIHT